MNNKNYKYKKVVRTWTKKDGTKVTKTYYYGATGRVEDTKATTTTTEKYKPGVARQKQKASTAAKVTAKKNAAALKRRAKVSERSRIRHNRRFITDKHGKIIKKVYDELVNEIKNDSSLGRAEKESYISWLEFNKKTKFSGTPHMRYSTAKGVLAGNRIEQMLEDTGFGIGAMVEVMQNYGDTDQTIDELIDISNWDQSIYKSPRGYIWSFTFKYLQFPFDILYNPQAFEYYNMGGLEF